MVLPADEASRDRVLVAAGVVAAVDPREARHLLLTKIFACHCLLDIHLDGEDAAYQSAIIELLPDAGYLVIDELMPHGGDALAARLPNVRVRTRVNGMEVKFLSRILARGSQSGLPYYKVRYPDEIEYPQRRREFRVNLPFNHSVPVRFETRTGAWARGEIRDLSAGGFCARLLSGDVANLAQYCGHTSACEIGLPGHGTLRTLVELRHMLPSRARSAPRVGARFVALDPHIELELKRYIAELNNMRLGQR